MLYLVYSNKFNFLNGLFTSQEDAEQFKRELIEDLEIKGFPVLRSDDSDTSSEEDETPVVPEKPRTFEDLKEELTIRFKNQNIKILENATDVIAKPIN
jgi:Holliday junction resolvase